MIVMKFGGTSVGSPEAIRRTVGIIGGRLSERPLVVVSAMSKVTDLLYSIADNPGDSSLVDALRKRHYDVASALLSGEDLERCIEDMDVLIDALPGPSKAAAISTGELLSSTLIARYMNANGIRTSWMDVRDTMVLEGDPMKAAPITDELSRRAPKAFDAALSRADAVLTQGFIGRLADGSAAVLGRGGSDYSASLLGSALGASRIEIWTDVDGVKTADPRKVEGTRSLDAITFEQASEMAHFGAKVLHPLTMQPAVRTNIPILVLNSMNPAGKGTTITAADFMEDGLKSLSSKDKIVVMTVSGGSSASRLLSLVFPVLSSKGISPDMMASSEGKVFLTLEDSPAVDSAAEEIGRFADVSLDRGRAQVTIIGKNISDIRSKVIKAYPAAAPEKVYMVSYGETYVNLSFAVPRELLDSVLRGIHKELF
ncbi:MAG: aspartate kinase [Bacteroidales bacterium]|nr:aspartate kinase [Bacteroidales bacterium]